MLVLPVSVRGAAMYAFVGSHHKIVLECDCLSGHLCLFLAIPRALKQDGDEGRASNFLSYLCLCQHRLCSWEPRSTLFHNMWMTVGMVGFKTRSSRLSKASLSLPPFATTQSRVKLLNKVHQNLGAAHQFAASSDVSGSSLEAGFQSGHTASIGPGQASLPIIPQ